MIMKNISQKKRRLLRFLFGTFSATAIMFTFQACYGPPQRQEEIPDDEVVLIEEQDSLNVENADQTDDVYTLEENDEE